LEKPAARKSGLVDLWCLTVLLALQALASPWWNLTETPPVYHDEYIFLSPSLDLLDGRGLALSFLRTPPNLTDILGVSPPVTVPRQPSSALAFAAALGVFGPDIAVARGLSYALGLVCILATYFLGRRASGPGAGLFASALLALDSNFWLASRQVRPETLTVSLFLLSALLLPWALQGNRPSAALLSGTLLGLGLLGHPVGASGFVGALILSLPFWKHAVSRVRTAVISPLVILGGAYLGFIAYHWDGFRQDLQSWSATRGLASVRPGPERELARYLGGYDNAYWMKFGEPVFIACLLLCAAFAVRALARRDFSARFSLIAVAAGLVTMFLARDLNALYLVNLAPWIYLGGATALASSFPSPVDRRLGLRPRIAVLSLGALGLATPYVTARTPSSLGFDRIEETLEPALPRGATLMGTETAFLMSRRRGAAYLYSLQYSGHTPKSARYPVSASWTDQSHLTRYSVNLSVVRALAERGPFYLFLDQWDLAWNLYAPFGIYAPVYQELNETLKKCFEPRVQVLTLERGLTSLWIYRENPDPEAWRRVPFFDGDRPARIGEEAPILEGGPRRFEATRPEESRTVFATEPEARYWLHFEAASEQGALVVFQWNGETLTRQLDARVPIPFDVPVQATGSRSELLFISYAASAPVSLTNVRAIRMDGP